MKHTIQIEAMHSLRIGELLELEQKMSAFDLDKLAARSDMCKGLNAGLDEDESGATAPYQVIEGTAIIGINGPLLSTSTFLSKWMGYASYPDIRSWMMQAASDPDVKDILLMIGSPGGSVFGITDGTEAIRKVNTIKPVYAYTNKNCCSGAYWLASAASEIMASPESETGSIGVIVTHASYEKQLESEGIKITILRSSELKAIGGPYKDLTDKEIAHIQEQVETFNGLFCNQIQTARPQVKFSAMNGQTFIGADAQRQGLVDRVCSYDDALAYIQAKRPKSTTQVGGYNMKLTAETLKVALDAGKTLEDLGITQEEMEAIMATDVTAEPGESAVDGEGQQDPGVVEPDAEGEGLDASAEMKLVIEQQQIEITTLIEQKSQLEAAAKEMKEIVIGVLNNRRIALGLTKLDMEAFSLPSILADYKAVSAEFDKSFKTGGVFKQKPEETKTVSVATDRAHAGLLQAAA